MASRKSQPKAVQKGNAAPRLLQRAWGLREPVLWTAVVLLVISAQWPTLKGWYYGVSGTPEPSSAVAWRSDYGTALSEARSSRKLVLVDFSASWCPPCVAMKRDVWPDSEVGRAVASGFIPLAVDADDDHGLSSKYQVDGIPAILVLDGEGRVVRRHDGFLSRASMLQFLGSGASPAAGD